MKKYLTGFFLILNAIGFSQSFPTIESDPKWNVLYWEDAQTGYGQTKTVRFIGDTLHCGKSYGILSDSYDSFYLRTDSVKTYVKFDLDCDSAEYLLYDFGLKLHDTIFVPLMTDRSVIDSIPVRVDSIYQIDNLGLKRKAYTIAYSPDGGLNFFRFMTWISGIGSTFHPIYSKYYPIDAWETDYNLLCYDSLGNNVYKNTFYNTCDTSFNGWVGIDNSINQSGFFIYPNPAKDFVTISGLADFDSYNIQIADINGRILYSSILRESTIDLSGFKNGLYMLTIIKKGTNQMIMGDILLKTTRP